ncbi:MAG: carbohydrate ABC transporter permease [Clostridia bacterium]|nr:carbohydrate ABC transporter permease [Clostridia bacterium]
MAVPIVGALPSEIRIARALGFYDNLIGMWLMKANFLGMYYLIFQANFKSLPWEYAESVFIDGGGHYTVLFKIMLPLSKTTIWVVAMLLFIQFWNDYQTPMMFIPSMPTAAIGLYKFRFVNISQANFGGVPMQMTGCIILMLPMMILFMFIKDKMMGNLTLGGLKG